MALPAKSFHTLAEAAKRLNTSVDHILDLLGRGWITPSYRFHELWGNSYVGDPPEIDIDGKPLVDSSVDDECVRYSESQLIITNYCSQPKVRDSNGAVCIRLTDCCLSLEGRAEHEDIELILPDPEIHDELIPIEKLVITQLEIERVENVQSLTEKVSELTDKERGNLLKLLAVLARVLVESTKGQIYGSLEKPNVGAISKKIEMHLDSYPELASQGLSRSNLQKKISAGLKKLEKSS